MSAETGKFYSAVFGKNSSAIYNYSSNPAKRLHINAERIRYIGKESNNLDETNVLGIDDQSYLEYVNENAFRNWVLALRPKDVREIGISERGL